MSALLPPGADDGLREAIRQTIDDETLMRTGRSVGDIASGHVTDAVLALPEVQRFLAADAAVQRLFGLADEWERRGTVRDFGLSLTEAANRIRNELNGQP